jgi:hypothetical protein
VNVNMNLATRSVASLRAAAGVLRRAARLDGRDWLVAVSTLSAALVVEIGLRTMRLPTLARMVRVPLSAEQPSAAPTTEALDLPPGTIRRLNISARIMQRWPFDEKCLRRSLVCGSVIRASEPQLVVGVALVDGEVKAHAWLTVGGVSLDPSGSAAFLGLAPVTSPPTTTPR